jgi:hypothetical protein
VSDFADRMQARREAEEIVEPTTPARKSRSLLPSPAPAAGASREELMAWATVVLGLGSDPIVNVTRFGRHEDARMVLTLKSGQRIVFERQADVFDPPTLRRRIIIATSATIPHYGGADVQTIATALLRLAELASEDDDRGEALEWADAFLAASERNTFDVATIATAAGRYEALGVLNTDIATIATAAGRKALGVPVDWAPPDIQAPAAERSIVVRDAQTGTRLVRTSDFAAHVRGMTVRPISWAALHSRMVEIGWEHRGQVEQRQPNGHGRLKAHVYAIPPSWDTE